MLKLHAIAAHHGDCLLLETKIDDKPRYILVDGGPEDTYDPHLRSVLKSKVARNGGMLEALILSHVDGDHVTGLLDMFVDLRSAVDEDKEPLVKIKELWHNGFGETVARDTRIETRFRALMDNLSVAGLLGQHGLTSLAFSTIAAGARLQREARIHRVPRNRRWDGEPVVADGSRPKRVAGLSCRIVGPTPANLATLRAEWKTWLDRQEEAHRRGQLAAMSDKSVPNLSSIQVLVEAKDSRDRKRRLLLTGDARGDHLLDALEYAGLLDDEGGIDLDVFKVPHHGSNRNVNLTFFRRVRAKTYVISGDGANSNPDLDTLQWIVRAASEDRRKITIVLTNATNETRELERTMPPRENGYTLKVRAPDRHYITVNVAS